MTNIPNFVRDRLKAQTSASDHPDANLLTAFSEHALVDPERAHVLAHLAQCADCRDVLAQALPPAEERALVPSPAPSNSWLRGPVLRWASLAACVVVVAAAALLLQNKPPAATHSEVDVILPAAPQPAAPKEEAATKADKITRQAELKLVHPPAAEARNGALLANKVAPGPELADQSADQSKVLARSKTIGAFVQPTPHADDSLDRQAPAPIPGANLRRDATLANAPQAAPVVGGAVAARGQASATMGRMVVAQAQSAPAANPAPPAAPEPVEVTSEAAAVGTENAPAPASPGKAKAGSAAQMQTAEAVGAAPLAKKQLAYADTKISVMAAGSRWALSSQGQLQRSKDGGSTWEPVPVVENVTFRALSAFGNNIWVGGLAGMLYHSSDAGTHWTQVRPAANEVTLTGDIVSLRFADPQHGQLSTSTNETWITTDAGRTWLKSN